MSAFNRLPTARGATAVEFAIFVMTFFTFVFGIIEVARLLYVYNTLQEVTRRAAAAAIHVYPNDPAIAAVARNAVFRNAPGELVLAPPVTDSHVRLTWLKWDLTPIAAGALPLDAARNRQICTADPHAANCIRFVQAQICDPADSTGCSPVASSTLMPLVTFGLRPLLLHMATTIAPVVTLGYVPGTSPLPCPCS